MPHARIAIIGAGLSGLYAALLLERQGIRDVVLLERTNNAPPERLRGYVNAPASMRLLGGMSTLTDALHGSLKSAHVVTGQTVRRLRNLHTHIELDSEDHTGTVTTWHVEHVLLAVPPRLAVTTLAFEPDLPQTLVQQWRNTATWMALHAKIGRKTRIPRPPPIGTRRFTMLPLPLPRLHPARGTDV